VSHFSAPCWLICCWSIPASLLHSNKWIRYMLKLLLSPCYYMSLLVWFFLEISTCIMHSSSTCLSLEFLLDHSLFWPLDLFMFMLMVVCLSAMLFEIRLRFQFFLKMILKRKTKGVYRSEFVSQLHVAPCVVKQILGIFLELLCVYLSACSVSSCDVQFLVAKSISHQTQIHF
jgi:hypothetical protein